MSIWDRAADRIERDTEQERDYGRLVCTSADGSRTYESAGRITITSPEAPTLRTVVAGVDLAALR